MGTVTLEVVGAKGLARALVRASEKTDPEIGTAIKQTARQGVVVFRRRAPKDSGRLARSISFATTGSGAEITSDAQDPHRGFRYTGVTRFGHRKSRIVPQHAPAQGRYIAPIPGVGPRWVEKRAALGPIPGIGFRASVRGYKPRRDWAEQALPTIALFARTQLRYAAERVIQVVR